jgi:CheY-like chemotaxis protein
VNSETNDTQPQAPIVLVVEEDLITRKVIGQHLQAAGYDAILVSSAADALVVAQRTAFHVLVLDLNLLDPDPFNGMIDGFAVLDWLRRQLKEFHFRTVIHSWETGQHVLEKAEKHGAFAFCYKRGDMTHLLQCVHDAVLSLKAPSQLHVDGNQFGKKEDSLK